MSSSIVPPSSSSAASTSLVSVLAPAARVYEVEDWRCPNLKADGNKCGCRMLVNGRKPYHLSVCRLCGGSRTSTTVLAAEAAALVSTAFAAQLAATAALALADPSIVVEPRPIWNCECGHQNWPTNPIKSDIPDPAYHYRKCKKCSHVRPEPLAMVPVPDGSGDVGSKERQEFIQHRSIDKHGGQAAVSAANYKKINIFNINRKDDWFRQQSPNGMCVGMMDGEGCEYGMMASQCDGHHGKEEYKILGLAQIVHESHLYREAINNTVDGSVHIFPVCRIHHTRLTHGDESADRRWQGRPQQSKFEYFDAQRTGHCSNRTCEFPNLASLPRSCVDLDHFGDGVTNKVRSGTVDGVATMCAWAKYTLADIIAEVAKCRPLCGNCHYDRTGAQRMSHYGTVMGDRHASSLFRQLFKPEHDCPINPVSKRRDAIVRQ